MLPQRKHSSRRNRAETDRILADGRAGQIATGFRWRAEPCRPSQTALRLNLNLFHLQVQSQSGLGLNLEVEQIPSTIQEMTPRKSSGLNGTSAAGGEAGAEGGKLNLID